MSVELGVWTCPRCDYTVRDGEALDRARLVRLQRRHGRRCQQRDLEGVPS